MEEIDLRLEDQRVRGFYIWKRKNSYDVGKNGTSIHTSIPKSDTTKQDIWNYISANS